MKTVSEALNLIKQNMTLPRHGETTTETVMADRDYPPFHRVMMDGIAVSWEAFNAGKREFKVQGIMPAGVAPETLSDPANCFEVMTGAPLPFATDLVIPYEHLSIENNVAKVTLETPRTQMENVHLKGSDVLQGALLLNSGERINGPHVGIAASVGQHLMNQSVRINIISTGDELVAVDETPLDHQIRRSNAHALKESLRLHGFHHVELSHLSDEEKAIEEHYAEAKKNFDLLIYSGGVSRGKFDYLPMTWKRLGVKEIFHGISQRPGKPLWFGVDENYQTTVMGLPGNPVSSLVCLHRYFLSQRPLYAQLTSEIIFKKDLTFFVPVKLESDESGTLKAHPLNIKNSGEFTALAGSDGFIELPKDKSVFKPGEAYLVHLWRPL